MPLIQVNVALPRAVHGFAVTMHSFRKPNNKEAINPALNGAQTVESPQPTAAMTQRNKIPIATR